MSDRVEFRCNGAEVAVEAGPGVSLLAALREELGLVDVKDGCAPQGQCGCCTVLVDGDARVACVTPVTRVAGREVTTPEGLDAPTAERFTAAFVATGGSQCGFCTPGIVMRAVAASTKVKSLDGRALAAHLCRCTGWQTISEAAEAADDITTTTGARSLDAASRRASLEGGPQRVDGSIPLGRGGFADDTAPRDALVAVPLPPGSEASGDAVAEAAGVRWVVGDSLLEARERAGKVQGRRTTLEARPPLDVPDPPPDGVALATSWVEPAYLEPDASWCEPGGEPATPLANGGAFGGKVDSLAPLAARELAAHFGHTTRVVYAREDVVRLGPKRPPAALTARYVAGQRESGTDGLVEMHGTVAGTTLPFALPVHWPYRVAESGEWTPVELAGPPTSSELRAVGLAERAVLLEGALTEAGVERSTLWRDDRVADVALDTCVDTGDFQPQALAGARIHVGDTGIERVEIRVAAGDPLDEVVLRSYAIGAAHMALGWVCTEGLTVDPDGEVLDLTIRSFGIIRAAETPPIDVTIDDDPGEPIARSSDAVFAAVAAAMWNTLTLDEGARPPAFPARETRLARTLRR